MRNQVMLKSAVFVLCFAWLGATARAQSTTPPPDAPTPAPTPKDTTKTPPDAAAPKKTDKKPSTADDNPFPEDISKKAAAEAKADAANTSNPDAPAPRTPSDEPKGSSSLDGMDKLGLDDPARKQLKVESPDGSPDVYDPKRASEDVRVGKFYLQTGDPKGAYARFKDATDHDHEDVEAVFWLAEAARKMNHSQEALQNYQLYLEANPDGPNSKAARKAMNELASSTKP
jgi:tetratricopeptide (TPR) repeat protein